jgi:hypothetical protein
MAKATAKPTTVPTTTSDVLTPQLVEFVGSGDKMCISLRNAAGAVFDFTTTTAGAMKMVNLSVATFNSNATQVMQDLKIF